MDTIWTKLKKNLGSEGILCEGKELFFWIRSLGLKINWPLERTLEGGPGGQDGVGECGLADHSPPPGLDRACWLEEADVGPIPLLTDDRDTFCPPK